MKKFKVIEAFVDAPTGLTYSVGDTYETADKERIDLFRISVAKFNREISGSR